MSNYRFGLKKLNEKARVEAKIKSIFGLKPISVRKKCSLSPLIIEMPPLENFSFCYGLLGKHQTNCDGPWTITAVNISNENGYINIDTFYILNYPIEVCSTLYDAYFFISPLFEWEIGIGLIYRYNEIEIYGIKWALEAPHTWKLEYTLQNSNGEIFECALILPLYLPPPK